MASNNKLSVGGCIWGLISIVAAWSIGSSALQYLLGQPVAQWQWWKYVVAYLLGGVLMSIFTWILIVIRSMFSR